MEDFLIKLIQGKEVSEKEIRDSITSLNNPDLVLTLSRGQKLKDSELIDELYEICEKVHSSCDSECPVYRLNGNKVPDTANDFKVNRGCDCFKSGKNMLEFIKNK